VIWLRYWKPVLCVLLAISWSGFMYRNGENHEHAKLVAHLLDDAKAAQKASEAARKHEQQDAANSAKVAEAYEQGKRDAEAAGKHVTDGLRAGTLKLRKQWQGCENRLSGTPAGSGQSDDSAESRAGSAGRIIGAADDDAAKIRALQKLLQAERK
jgi:hypothetical protein